jgi:1,4-alpha-glucan branching enzyme
MERLADKYAFANGLTLRALKQAERELLLAQASDWAFMLHSDTMGEYAIRRTKTHLAQFIRLKDEVESKMIDQKTLARLERCNNIFPQISPGAFR